MRVGAIASLAGLASLAPALAYRVPFADTDRYLEVCSGMFGGDKAYVEVGFESHSVGQVAMVIYEYHDSEYLGKQPPDDGSYHPKTFICTTTAVRSGLCSDAERGQFLFSLPEGKTLSDTSIYSTALRFDPTSKAVSGTGDPTKGGVDQVETEQGKEEIHGGSKILRKRIAAVAPQTTDEEFGDDDEEDKPVLNRPHGGGGAAPPPPPPSSDSGDDIGSTPSTPPPTDSVPIYSKPIRHAVPKTGYYCVGVIPLTIVTDERRSLEERKTVHAEYEGVITFRNQFDGELPAVEYPKIAFYGFLSAVYLILAIGWGYLCFRHYNELLPMQYYISGTIVFLVIEMVALFAYYRYINKHGGGAGSIAFLVVVSILNAARNSLSFFLLLIVSMGLSVVTPSLGPVMLRVWLLTAFHLVFGVMYSVGVVKVELDSTNIILVLLLIFPLSFTLTAFLMWIIVSLNGTILHLQERKQNFKLQMFRRLYRILVIAVIAVATFFVLSSISLSHRSNEDYAPRNWRWRWVLLDASLAMIYLVAFVSIAWLWRPTDNNILFSMSQELAQDDDDAEDYELSPTDAPPHPIGLEPNDDRDYIHGDGPAEERAGLFGGGNGQGHGGVRLSADRAERGERGERGGYAPHTNDDNVVFAMGDDSDEDDDSDPKELTRVSLDSSNSGGSYKPINMGRYRDI